LPREALALQLSFDAARAAYRLAHALRALDDGAREDVLGVLYLELAELPTITA
jgi:hypothetical protein